MQVWCNLIILGERSTKKFPYSIFVVFFFIILFVCLFSFTLKGFVTIQEIKRKKKKTKKKEVTPKPFCFLTHYVRWSKRLVTQILLVSSFPKISDYIRLHLIQIRESRLNKIHSGKRLRRTLSDEKPLLSIHLRRYGRRDNRWPQGR